MVINYAIQHDGAVTDTAVDSAVARMMRASIAFCLASTAAAFQSAAPQAHTTALCATRMRPVWKQNLGRPTPSTRPRPGNCIFPHSSARDRPRREQADHRRAVAIVRRRATRGEIARTWVESTSRHRADAAAWRVFANFCVFRDGFLDRGAYGEVLPSL